jgi:hypothetical protein
MFIADDEFLEPEVVYRLQQTMYANPGFHWYLHLNSIKKEDSKGQQYNNNTQLVHAAVMNNNDLSPFAGEGRNILNTFAEKHGIVVDSILRIKANLIFKKYDDDLSVNTPHIDMNPKLVPNETGGKLMVLLYYVNDSDGDTIFYEETFESSAVSEFTEAGFVTPKAGKAILFDADQYHSSSSPTDSKIRCVVNINFIGRFL